MTPMKINFGDERLPARFWAKVTPEPNSGCWLWTGCCDAKGYGYFNRGSRNNTAYAHRHAFLVLVGSIPEGLFCDHQCWNRACVNPNHIKLATPKENANNLSPQGRITHRATAARVGKLNLGEVHGMAKLIDAQVLEIRKLHAQDGCTQQELSDRFNVSRPRISDIVNRKAWKHI